MPSEGNFCAENSTASISITFRPPNVSLTPLAPTPSNVFPDCKGICPGDELTWVLTIAIPPNIDQYGNPTGNHNGPAYSPVLNINNQGPGMLDIAEVDMVYSSAVGTGGSNNYYNSTNTYNPNFSTNFANINLPLAPNSTNPYILPGDVITVAIHLFGDGNNTSLLSYLQAGLTYNDVCGRNIVPGDYVRQEFFFNTNSCSPCVPSACAGDPFPANGSPCDFGPPMEFQPTIQDAPCGSSSNTGSLSVNVSGGPPHYAGNGIIDPATYTYQWSLSSSPTTILSNTSVLGSIGSGTYEVTATTIYTGCSASASYTINNSGLTFTIEHSEPTCRTPNGSISLTGAGLAGCTYQWSDNENTSSINHLSAGNYTVTVTSPTCSVSAIEEIPLVAPSHMELNLTTSDLGCGNNTGAIAVSTVTNGTQPYTYSWNTNATTSSISGLASGTYSVTVGDVNLCAVSATATISNSPQLGSFNVIAPDICYGNSEPVTITATGFAGQTCTVYYTVTPLENTNPNPPFTGSSIVTFDQNGRGNPFPIYSNALFPSNVEFTNWATNFVVSITGITVQDDTTCTVDLTGNTCFNYSASFAVNIWPLKIVYLIGTSGYLGPLTVCLGTPISLQAQQAGNNGSPAVNNYEWSVNNTSIYPIMQGQTLDITPSATGTYVYQATYFFEGGQCQSSASITINVVGVTAALTAPIACNSSDTYMLTASPSNNVRYSWSPSPNSTSSNTATYTTPTQATTYSVTVTDISNSASCTSSAIAIVNPDILDVSVAPTSAALCGSAEQTFTASASGLGSDNPYTYRWSNGTNLPSTTVSTDGNYNVTATDGHGCTASASASISTGSELSISVTETNGTSCTGGSATAVVNDGIDGQTYAYSWSPGGATTIGVTNVSSGSYTVTVTAASGCTGTASTTVTGTAALTIDIEATSSNCFPLTINSNVTGGDSSYSYSWGDGSTAASVSDAGPGAVTYTLTVTDGGCSATATKTIPADANLSATLTPTPLKCFQDNTGQLSAALDAGQGIGVLTFSWSNDHNITISYQSGVGAGPYTVTITDAVGCSATASAIIMQPAAIGITPHEVDATCNTDTNGSINIDVSGGTTPYTYSWAGHNANTTTQNQSSIGIGTYTVTVTDGHNCTATSSSTVSSTNLLTVALSANNGTCSNNGSITATVTSNASAPYSYSWSNGASGSAITNTIPAITDLNTGTYSILVNDMNGCSATASITVTNADPISVSATATNVKCNGENNGSVNATMSVGNSSSTSYVWSNSTTTQNLSNVPSGAYSVTATVISTGCTATASTIVTQPAPLEVTLGITNIECGEGSIMVNTTGGTQAYSYLWSNGWTTNQDPRLTAGNYTITITDYNGCSITTSGTVNTFPGMALSAIVADITCGQSGEIDLTVTPGLAPFSYSWNTSATAQNIVVTDAGFYSVTVTDHNGCTIAGDYQVDNANTAPAYQSTAYPYLINLPMSNFTAGSIISLNGNFAVDAINNNTTVTFTDITIIMGSNSNITIHTGQILNLIGCTLEGCTELWDGIYIEPGGRLNITDDPISEGHPEIDYPSIFQDAMNGVVYSDASAKMFLINTSFIRNQRSVQIVNVANAMVPANYKISNCYFGMGNANVGAGITYTNMLNTTIGNRPLFAIYVYRTAGIEIPNPYYTDLPNTFENMNCGIKSINSQVSVHLNTFNNIQPYDNADVSKGSAIYAATIFVRGKPYLPGSISVVGVPGRLSLLPSTVIPGTPVHFTNCLYGVNATAVKVNVTSTNMSAVLNGIWTSNCVGSVSATYNTIGGANKGITLNSNMVVQNILGNTITANEPVGGALIGIGYPLTYCIYEKYSGVQGNANIIGNNLQGGRYGIFSMNSNSSNITINTISNPNTTAVTSTEAGIFATGCNNIIIEGNHIDGNGNQYYDQLVSSQARFMTNTSAYRKSGIYLSGTQTGIICNNVLGVISPIGYDMYFVGDCHMVKTNNNKLWPSKFGTVLTEQGATKVIGDQGSLAHGHGNNFDNDVLNSADGFSSGDRTYAFNFGSFNPPIFFSFNDYERPRPTGAIIPGTFNILEIGDLGANAQSLSCAAPKLRSHARFNSLHNPYDEALAGADADTLMQIGFESTATWLLQRRLYANLCDSAEPVLTVNNLPSGFDTVLTAFIDTATDSNMVSIAVDLLGELLSDTASSIPVDSSALLDTTLANFYLAEVASDFNAIQAYENQLAITDTSYWQKDPKDSTTIYSDAWNSANSLHAAIPTINIQAYNYKIIQAVYLHLINPTDTSAPDSSALTEILNIAIQCPYTAGDAVYRARALYAQFVDSIYFDDLELCEVDSNGHSDRMLMVHNTQDTTVNADSVVQEFVKLYPNPAKQLFNLAYFVKANGMINFEIFDQLGELIIESRLTGGANFAQYSTTNLSNGIYYWRLRDTDRTIKTGKLAIMK